LHAQYRAPERPLDPANIDRKFGACQDFYMFANNGWIQKNPIPPAFSSWGSFNELSERNNLVLKDVVERAAREAPTTTDPATKKLGTYYSSCMDSTAAERAGIAPISDELSRIAAIGDRAQLKAQIARMHSLGLGSTFGFGSGADAKNARMVIANAVQGGTSLPDRDYYLRDDPAMQSIRTKYVDYMTKLFALAGDAPETAASDAQKVLALETALARGAVPRVQLRDPNSRYHPMTIAEANALTPAFSWSDYLLAIGLAQVASLNVGMPTFFQALNTELEQRPLDDWKAYLRWVVLSRNAAQLSAPFVNEQFRFASVLTGAREQQPRWKRCLQAADQSLGDALGKEYVKVVFTPEAKAKMLGMVTNLRTVLRERIQKADWMSEATRAQALQKMDSFNQKIGYPDSWRDYAGLTIEPGPFVNNALRVRAYETKRDYDKIGKPLDRAQWSMTPPTVNAYYSPPLNEIVFPAGRLQAPFFSVSYDDAANYGGVGGTIGHEMSHGFDDSGRQYDAQGNLRDWWTADDASRYKRKAQVVEDQYGAYVAVDTLRVNGKLTLGENLADVVGVSVAYEALERALAGKPRATIDGFTPEQRFFLAYAQARMSVLRPETARMLVATDPHSPGQFRVNGPLSNMPEFAHAFGCKEGDPMVRADSVRANIW
ncbi:MAG: M13 family metallopeptidase, partial [Gemmatimonadota bacterium]|nr:M13 family metallopeptidase [Gemmatimonadota bacterium]